MPFECIHSFFGHVVPTGIAYFSAQASRCGNSSTSTGRAKEIDIQEKANT
jgi:hypothetical protein